MSFLYATSMHCFALTSSTLANLIFITVTKTKQRESWIVYRSFLQPFHSFIALYADHAFFYLVLKYVVILTVYLNLS